MTTRAWTAKVGRWLALAGLAGMSVSAQTRPVVSNAPVRVPVEKPLWFVTNQSGTVSTTNRPPAVPQRIEVKEG